MREFLFDNELENYVKTIKEQALLTVLIAQALLECK